MQVWEVIGVILELKKEKKERYDKVYNYCPQEGTLHTGPMHSLSEKDLFLYTDVINTC